MTVFRNWVFERTRISSEQLDIALKALTAKPGRSSALRQLVRKDQLVFTRDASQWSQILIVVAIIIIYLVNFKYFEVAADQALIGDIGLVFFNLAACGFVVVALCGRFLFPGVSLEGRSFWLILQAPVSLERFLVGKWLGGILPIVIIGQLLIWSSNLLVGMSLTLCAITSVQILVISFVASAMATGMGAIYPQFHNPNPARIASSFGAVIFMISTIFIVLFLIATWFQLSLYLSDVGARSPKLFHWFTAICGLLLAAGLIPFILKSGAFFLRRRF